MRDLPGIQALGFQLFDGGVSVSHAYAHVVEFGAPVEMGGLRIASGDLLHGDPHGVQLVPIEAARELPALAEQVLRDDRELFDLTERREYLRGNVVRPVAEDGAGAPVTTAIPHGPPRRALAGPLLVAIVLAALIACLAACSGPQPVGAVGNAEGSTVVGVVQVARKPLLRQIAISSELVPLQEIDVYAKESGYVTDLRVDYGSRVERTS